MSPPRNATVSLCMIVRNEEHQLEDCLAPVAELFDDIVIVDTGSQDGTRRLAERYTPRVVDFQWCDDFSAARNESLRHARGEWVFWIDADDRVTPPHVDRLRRLLDGLADAPQAFLMETVLHQDEQARDRERITTHLRLFRRHPALSWRRRVHEELAPWPTALGYDVACSEVRIEHLGYRDNQLTQRKLRRNVRLLQMDFALTPDDASILMDLGSAHAQLGDSAEARRLLRAVIAQRPPCPVLLRRAYMTLAELETAEGNFSAAAQVLAPALGDFPGEDYLLYMHSEALYNLGHHAQSRAELEEILRQTPARDRFRVGVPGDLRQRLVPLALGEVLRAQLALREAEQVLRQVTRDFPTDPSAWFFLGRVYIDWRSWSQLDAVTARLNECANGALFAGLLRAWSQLARGEWLETEATLDELIPQAPAMTLLRIMRVECLHRRQAPPPAQVQACRDLLRLQPQNGRAREILRRMESSALPAQRLDADDFCTSVLLGVGVADAT